MSKVGRFVYLNYHGVNGEIVILAAYSAKVKYNLGGFEYEEWFSDDDYIELPYFEEDDE